MLKFWDQFMWELVLNKINSNIVVCVCLDYFFQQHEETATEPPPSPTLVIDSVVSCFLSPLLKFQRPSLEHECLNYHTIPRSRDNCLSVFQWSSKGKSRMFLHLPTCSLSKFQEAVRDTRPPKNVPSTLEVLEVGPTITKKKNIFHVTCLIFFYFVYYVR